MDSPASRPENIVPDRLDFSFDYDARFNLLIQRRDTRILEYLSSVYRADANIGYLQEGYDIAKPYASDFMNFLDRVLTAHPSVQSALEIGCGGCMVLHELQKRGLRVLGVDPGPLALRSGKKWDIPIVSDVFPSTRIQERYDLILHTDVLEHVVDPLAFLRSQRDALTDDGLLLISIPDCTESIQRGDISLVLHQHLNYFDAESLAAIVAGAGFEVLEIEVAGYGGSLYCLARKASRLGDGTCDPKPGAERKYERFLTETDTAIEKFRTFCAECLRDPDNALGFYVPLRAIPYLATVDRADGFRLFDDTDHWHHRSFDGLPIPVENMADLSQRPVSHLVIMSLTFADAIRRKVRKNLGDRIQIKELRDFLS
jgi:2-polyprenyl-3-methyl-5-hydroxy-6-metoxy-1,4-benzoquinol methylase